MAPTLDALVIARFVRAGGRRTEGDAPHLLEAIAVVVFDHTTGEIVQELPPAASGLRWEGFIAGLAAASTTQTRSFSSASAPGLDEAGFWPVTSLPSVTTKGTQLATFS